MTGLILLLIFPPQADLGGQTIYSLAGGSLGVESKVIPALFYFLSQDHTHLVKHGKAKQVIELTAGPRNISQTNAGEVIRAQPFLGGGQVTSFFPPRGCWMLLKSQKSIAKVSPGLSPGGLPYSSQWEPQSILTSMVAFWGKESWKVP